MGRLAVGLALGTGNAAIVAAAVDTTPRNAKYFFSATRLEPLKSTATASAGREVLYSRVTFATPDYPTSGWRFYFANWYVDQADVTNAPEKDIATPCDVEAYVELGGVHTRITFAGQNRVTIPPGGGLWCDEIPGFSPNANVRGFVKTADIRATGELRPVGPSRMSSLGEAAEWAATFSVTKINGTSSISNTASGSWFAPVAAVAKGNDGRTVALVVGDSITFGLDETSGLADGRGNIGAWRRGLDENVIGERIPYGMFAAPGTRPSGTSTLNAGAWRRRHEVLSSLPDLPFDVIIDGYGVNDANTNLATWQNSMQTNWDFLTSLYHKPIYQVTLTPKSSATGNVWWTDLSHQTPAADVRVALNDWIRTIPSPLAGIIDMAPAYADAAELGKWAVRPFTTTFASAYAGGTSGLSLANAPVVGEQLVFADGTSSKQYSTVIGVSGAGPYTVTVNNTISAYASGATVKANPTDDGLHPTTIVHKNAAANVVAPWKVVIS